MKKSNVKKLNIVKALPLSLLIISVLALAVCVYHSYLYTWGQTHDIVLFLASHYINAFFCLKFSVLQKKAFTESLNQKEKDIKYHKRIINDLKSERAWNESKLKCAEELVSINDQLTGAISFLEKQIEEKNEYIKSLSDIYFSCSDNRDTRAYVSLILERQDIDLFDPVKYVSNQNYAKVVDLNAKRWIERFKEPDTFLVRHDIKKELRDAIKKPTFSGVSTMPMLALEHPIRNPKKDEESLER